MALVARKNGVLEILMNHGRTESRWSSDPDAIHAGQVSHITVTVDGGT